MKQGSRSGNVLIIDVFFDKNEGDRSRRIGCNCHVAFVNYSVTIIVSDFLFLQLNERVEELEGKRTKPQSRKKNPEYSLIKEKEKIPCKERPQFKVWKHLINNIFSSLYKLPSYNLLSLVSICFIQEH